MNAISIKTTIKMQLFTLKCQKWVLIVKLYYFYRLFCKRYRVFPHKFVTMFQINMIFYTQYFKDMLMTFVKFQNISLIISFTIVKYIRCLFLDNIALPLIIIQNGIVSYR